MTAETLDRKIAIVTAEMSHADLFEYDGIEMEILQSIDWRAQLKGYLTIGPAWTILSGEEIIGIGGYFTISKGVLQAWMLFNQGARIARKAIASDFKKKLREAMEENHRIQTYVFEGQDRAAGYVRIMGFEEEARLKAFGPNKENVHVYSMVNP